MYRIEKITLCLLCLLVVATIGSPIVAYWVNQPHQHEIQEKVLKFNLAKVRKQNTTVSLVARRALLRTTNGDFLMNKPMLFSIGSQFLARDRHWSATYTISGIDSDGVNIHFDANGDDPAAVRRSSGTVKLPWK